MSIINDGNVVKTYKITKQQLIKLIAKDLDVPENELELEFNQIDVSNERYDRTPRYETNSVTITHKPKKNIDF